MRGSRVGLRKEGGTAPSARNPEGTCWRRRRRGGQVLPASSSMFSSELKDDDLEPRGHRLLLLLGTEGRRGEGRTSLAMASQNSSLLRPPDWFASMIWRGRETGREYSLQKTKENERDKEGETSVTSEREGGERDRDVETDG